MLGGTGGYLVGYLLAALALGFAARRGWDRSVLGMAAAMLVGNVLIYVPGLLWLGHLVAGGLFDPAKYASRLGADAGLGPDALPDRRRAQARAGRPGRPGPLEAGGRRPRLTPHRVPRLGDATDRGIFRLRASGMSHGSYGGGRMRQPQECGRAMEQKEPSECPGASAEPASEVAQVASL